ncbi:NrtA/SsuA/CpmA family ABC transporter substrate-binding protein [Streptomyces erythrochromogenes]|uniref:NrtA/SsuA/CpmA family ABC transporter substrate-binding protein n=1 Tax=Streptomyces erythrochromogenes TaxID=285574 RepID=A0ABZ1QLW9_9ACTN|nr:NrtA/SsuA/CpmA family ABC transporter substrate-binding protein [Streptomyces erythrochromogenes]MCX5588914.1 NrtA/SsuA/CpmA family ABC transporter substrate-binding protein [Streptomyces erythrochromogenes]
MLRPRAAAALLMAALLTTFASACADGSDPANADGSGGRPAVSVVGSDHLGGAPVHVAQEHGLWSAEGIDVTVTTRPSGRDALNAVLGGQAQLGVVGDLPAVTAALGGRDLRIVADLSRFSDWRLLTRTDRAVTGFAALKGRKVGVPQGTNVEYALSRMLASARLTAADVTVVNLAPNQVTPALARGDIDAGVTFPSFYEAARTALGERYAELPFTGYTARTLLVAGAKTSDETTAAVLRTVLRAQREIGADPARARQAVVAQSKGALQTGYVDAYQSRYTYGATLSTELLTQLEEEAAWAKAAQGLPGSADRAALQRYLNPGPLTAVDRAAVTVR